MTDAKFKQLVNSFLDREISQKDHLLLAKEVAANPQRRIEFERYRKLHAAERQAFARLFGKAAPAGGPGADTVADALDDGSHAAERQAVAAALKARAARAWSDVQLLAVERRKRMVLIVQFALVGVAVLLAAFTLYHYAVEYLWDRAALRRDSEVIAREPDSLLRITRHLREHSNVNSVEWVNNSRGEPVAVVGRSMEGGVFVVTNPEMPRLNHSELAILMEQLEQERMPGAVRSRFIVTSKVSNRILPEVGNLMPVGAIPRPSPSPVAAPVQEREHLSAQRERPSPYRERLSSHREGYPALVVRGVRRSGVDGSLRAPRNYHTRIEVRPALD